MTDGPSQLTWDVYVTAEEPIVTDDLPPRAPPSGDGRGILTGQRVPWDYPIATARANQVGPYW
jgi:hypothetical protein